MLRHHMDLNSESKFNLYDPLLLLFPNKNYNNDIVVVPQFDKKTTN